MGKTIHTTMSQIVYQSIQEYTVNSTTVHEYAAAYNHTRVDMIPRQVEDASQAVADGFENRLEEFLTMHRTCTEPSQSLTDSDQIM